MRLLWATTLPAALVLQGCFKKDGQFSHLSFTGGAAKCSAVGSHGRRMACGAGVEVCGVLTLETGEGSGNYRHPEPVVHGLWPQTENFGSSECDRPDSAANPRKIYPCFDTQNSQDSAVWFQRHEWEKHGVCAGVRDADDFFKQVCQLSSAPLQVMTGARAANLDLVDMAEQLQRSGYCVYHIDTYNKQMQLSACQDDKGIWHLSDVNGFPAVCGGAAGGGASSGGQCISGQRGPRCSSDADCWGKTNCQRCAHSGYCTDVPLRSLSELWSFDFQKAPKSFVVVNVMLGFSFLFVSLILLRRRSTGQASVPLIQPE